MLRKGLKSKTIISILALSSTIALSWYSEYNSGSIMNIFFLCLIFWGYSKYGFDWYDKKVRGYSLTVSGIFAFVLTMGRIMISNESILDSLYRKKQITIKDAVSVRLGGWGALEDIITIIVVFIGLWILFYFLFSKLFSRLEMQELNYITIEKSTLKKIGLFTFFFILLCWLPYFIVYYPGICTYDSIVQIMQAKGQAALTNHHPVLHTMLIKLCYQIGEKIGKNSNFGVAFYSLVQMGILALIYSYTIIVLRKIGLSLKWCIVLILYYAINPLHAIYAITMWKDVLYAGILLWFTMIILQLCVMNNNKKSLWILLSVSAFLVSMIRNNGIIVIILSSVILLKYKKDFKKKLFVVLVVPTILYIVITGPIYNYFNIGKSNITESLSTPLQHISRVVVEHENELKEHEIEDIQKLASLDEIRNIYNSRLADPIKNLVVGNGGDVWIKENKLGFFSLWLKLGLRYPLSYIKAELDTTLGHWYPDVQYYPFGEGIYQNDQGIYSVFWEQKIWQDMYEWKYMYEKVPILGNLNSMGTMFLALVLIMFIQMFCCDRYISISVPVFINWLTIMLATPVFAEMRYIYSLMIIILPIVLISLVLGVKWRKI